MIRGLHYTIRQSAKMEYNNQPIIMTYRSWGESGDHDLPGWQAHQVILKFENDNWEPGSLIMLSNDEVPLYGTHENGMRHYEWVADQLIAEMRKGWPGISGASAHALQIKLNELTPHMDSGVN